MLFRWRVQFGFGRRPEPTLAAVTLANAPKEALVLHNLLQPPDGTMVVELSDGRRIFAPSGSDPDAVRAHVGTTEIARR
jgi:hypothetical protein